MKLFNGVDSVYRYIGHCCSLNIFLTIVATNFDMKKPVVANISMKLAAGCLLWGTLLVAPQALATEPTVQNQQADIAATAGIQLPAPTTDAPVTKPADTAPKPWTLRKGDDTAPWRAERNEAVIKARQGKYDEALALLQKLHNDHPQDIGATQDLVAISSGLQKTGN